MDAARDALPDDIDALKAALLVERAKGLEVTAELAVARAKASEDVALIAQQKLRIALLERQVYGQRSERSARLIDQLALTFEELEASATEDELAAEASVAKTTTVAGFTRKRPERNTFPDHLPRILKRWAAFTLFLEDGRVCLSNNAAERGLRGIALGRKSWLFCG